MVEVIIKGMRKEPVKGSYEIAKIKAGVTLRDEGGIFLTISDMALSERLRAAFEDAEATEMPPATEYEESYFSEREKIIMFAAWMAGRKFGRTGEKEDSGKAYARLKRGCAGILDGVSKSKLIMGDKEDHENGNQTTEKRQK